MSDKSEITNSEIPASHSNRIYDRVFFCSYFANIFMLMSVSLLFRYADFVKAVGGDEWHLGWITGVGAVGAILFRIYQGTAIDRFGPILVWILSLIGLIVSNLLHLMIEDVNGWPVYTARLLMNLCTAGVFGAWLSFVTIRAPGHRTAEVIGVVGSSGFVGMALGPVLGDWVFSSDRTFEQAVDLMFMVSAGLSCGAMVCAALGGFIDARDRNSRGLSSLKSGKGLKPSELWSLLKSYHPGFVLVLGGIMGLTISLPGNFLRPFAEQQNIEQMKTFFVVYNIVAFVSRVSFRRAPEVLGLRNAILLGLGFMAVSMLMYNFVDSRATLLLPAVAGGLAHSFLFPSIVAAGTANFPVENRGLATSLILGMYDVGLLVGSPLVGISVTTARSWDWPEYPVTFSIVSVLLMVIGAITLMRYQRGDGKGMLLKNSR